MTNILVCARVCRESLHYMNMFKPLKVVFYLRYALIYLLMLSSRRSQWRRSAAERLLGWWGMDVCLL
jgi:hypothetical protein